MVREQGVYEIVYSSWRLGRENRRSSIYSRVTKGAEDTPEPRFSSCSTGGGRGLRWSRKGARVGVSAAAVLDRVFGEWSGRLRAVW